MGYGRVQYYFTYDHAYSFACCPRESDYYSDYQRYDEGVGFESIFFRDIWAVVWKVSTILESTDSYIRFSIFADGRPNFLRRVSVVSCCWMLGLGLGLNVVGVECGARTLDVYYCTQIAPFFRESISNLLATPLSLSFKHPSELSIFTTKIPVRLFRRFWLLQHISIRTDSPSAVSRYPTKIRTPALLWVTKCRRCWPGPVLLPWHPDRFWRWRLLPVFDGPPRQVDSTTSTFTTPVREINK